MKRLCLVRHGEIAGSEGRVIGHLDLPLSLRGVKQMETLAASWRGPAPARLFSSDLRRAVDSTRVLAPSLRCSPILDPRLRELSFGEWEGLEWNVVHEQYREQLAAWGERWWQIAPPGGETFAELSSRVFSWFQELGDEKEVVVVVAHGGSLRALLAALLGFSWDQVFNYRLDCAHASEIAISTNACELISLNQDRFRDIAGR